MASIGANGSGTLYLDFTFTGPDGKTYRAKESMNRKDDKAGRAAVELSRALIEAEIKAGRFSYVRHFPHGKYAALYAPGCDKRSPPFREYAEGWVEANRQPHGKHSPQTTYDYSMMLSAYAYPAFGSKAVDEITRQDIAALRMSMTDQPGSFNFLLARLRTVFREAVYDELTAKDPTFKIQNLATKGRDKTPYSIPEQLLIIQSMPDGWRPDEWRNYFTLAFFSGLRPGEQAALRCSDIDFDRGIIKVNKSMSGRFGEGPTKDKEGRGVPILSACETAILSQYAGRISDVTYLFCRPDGTAWSPDYIRKHIWNPTLQSLEEKGRLIKRHRYVTKHSFISNCLDAKEDKEWVAKVVGHTTSRLVEDVYGDIVPRQGRDDGERLSRKIADTESLKRAKSIG